MRNILPIPTKAARAVEDSAKDPRIWRTACSASFILNLYGRRVVSPRANQFEPKH